MFPMRASIPAEELISVRDAHLAKAKEYERGGNAQGAAQLRAVANLIQVILDGGKPGTVCP